jgi:hypothetical protein
MFQCDAEISRRTLTERRRINIPGISSNKSIIVQANDSIYAPRDLDPKTVSLSWDRTVGMAGSFSRPILPRSQYLIHNTIPSLEMSGDESDILRCLDEGMSFDEIAQELDMTAEQVYEIGTAFFDRAFEIWRKTKI